MHIRTYRIHTRTAYAYLTRSMSTIRDLGVGAINDIRGLFITNIYKARRQTIQSRVKVTYRLDNMCTAHYKDINIYRCYLFEIQCVCVYIYIYIYIYIYSII